MQRNDEAFEDLSFLRDLRNLDFTLHRDEDENLICCEIYIDRFLLPPKFQNSEDHECQEKAWYTDMRFENKTNSFFYNV